MGIFSLFGKKDRRQDAPGDKASTRLKHSPAPPVSKAAVNNKSITQAQGGKRDAQAALATALKIDAIESEMSSEFVATRQSERAAQVRKNQPPPPPATRQEKPQSAPGVTIKPPPTLALPTLPALEMGTTTQFLLDGSFTLGGQVAVAPSEAVAVIEEAAIMFANGRIEPVEQMLRTAIEEDLLGDVLAEMWLMLFDLYQISGKQQEFEQLAIAYASHFETSPPAWIAPPKQGLTSVSGAMPTVPFTGQLNADSKKNIERVNKLAETHHALRLEFSRVAGVDAEGCALLLSLLLHLQKSGHELVLVGAPELANQIRAILEVGRRDDSESSWLLLLEILRLLNREKEFEETSIDYCVTFEVSPPAFTAPQSKITTAISEAPQEYGADGFMMPSVVEGRVDNLILAIAAYSDEHNPAIIDCSRLDRVDFNAAGRLLTGLAPFCGVGRTLEFHHVNHLIAALFNVVGLKDIARVVPRKN